MIWASLALAAPAFEARMLWVDATANLSWSINADKVRAFCLNARKSGFNEIVVDVKPINGKLLFNCPGEEKFTSFRNVYVPWDYDLLQTFIDAGHREGLRVSASMNVFSEGHSYFPGEGLAYSRPDLQIDLAIASYTAVLRDGSRVPIFPKLNGSLGPEQEDESSDFHPITGKQSKNIASPPIPRDQILRIDAETVSAPQTKAVPGLVAVFVDPVSEEVRQRLFRIVRSLAKYDIDGIVFDRMRFPALFAGVNADMLKLFRSRYGPTRLEEIYKTDPDPKKGLQPGPKFPEWMQFRTEIVTEFVKDITTLIHSIKPSIAIGSFVGSGWETYYEVGVNYGADKPQQIYQWSLPSYGLSGYAGYFDFLLPGVFYKTASTVDPGVTPGRERFTVEGGAKLINQVVGDRTLVYPSLYGLDWEENTAGLKKAIQACRANGNGMMFFDAVYVVRNNWWSLFEAGFKGAPPQPAHSLPSYRKAVLAAL